MGIDFPHYYSRNLAWVSAHAVLFLTGPGKTHSFCNLSISIDVIWLRAKELLDGGDEK